MAITATSNKNPPSLKVMVISNVDPLRFPLRKTQDTNSGVDARWNSLWESFGSIYFPQEHPPHTLKRLAQWSNRDSAEPPSSPLPTNQTFPSELARPYFCAIWASLTSEEQLALFYLARDRFIHVDHPGLHPLLGKGLLVFDPNPRLMNEEFREFVLVAGEQGDLEKKVKGEKGSQWSMVKWPLVGSLGVLFFFLLFTQQEFRVALPAMISLLPVLFKGLAGWNQRSS